MDTFLSLAYRYKQVGKGVQTEKVELEEEFQEISTEMGISTSAYDIN